MKKKVIKKESESYNCELTTLTHTPKKKSRHKKTPSSESQKMTTRVSIMSNSLYLRRTYSRQKYKKICLSRREDSVRSAMDFSSKSAVSDRLRSRTFSRLLHAMYTQKTLRHNEWKEMDGIVRGIKKNKEKETVTA